MKILITGASKGIGLQIAKELAERGYELVLHCNSTEEALLAFVEENKKSIAVIAPAFSSDCIETLEEINEEIKESFEEAGGEEFTYIPCLNDSKAHIDALSALIDQNLSGWIN